MFLLIEKKLILAVQIKLSDDYINLIWGLSLVFPDQKLKDVLAVEKCLQAEIACSAFSLLDLSKKMSQLPVGVGLLFLLH